MTAVATARDIMLADATAACVSGGVDAALVVYSDVAPANLLDGKSSWCRATVKHAGGGQAGFGGDGTRKYDRFGTLSIEIFSPPGTGMGDGDTILDAVLLYLESVRSSPVWYRNIRASEVGRDGAYEKINVYADFQYESNH